MRRFALAWLLVWAAAAAGQVGGTIVDERSREPVDQVRVTSGRAEALTDRQGRFSLRVATPCWITCARIGYETRRLRVAAPDTAMMITLIFRPILLKGMQINGDRILPAGQAPFAEQPRSVLATVPATRGDLFKAVQAIPGVTALSDFGSQVYIRGGEADENLYLLDGAPITSPFHFLGIESCINLEQVEKIELSTGGFGAAYGSKGSGFLSVESKEPDATQVLLGADPLSAIASCATTVGPSLGFVLFGKRSLLNYWPKDLLGISSEIVLPDYTDFQWHGSWRSDRFTVRANMLRSHERTAMTFKDEATNDSLAIGENGNQGLTALSVHWHLGKTLDADATVYQQYSRFSIAMNTDWWARDEYQVQTGFTTALKARLPDAGSIACGLGWQSTSEHLAGSSMPDIDYIGTYRLPLIPMMQQIRQTSLFVSQDLPLTTMVDLTWGGRGEYLVENRCWYTAPRIALTITPISPFTVYLKWGHYHQAPSLFRMEAEAGSSLRMSNTGHYIAGIRWSAQPSWSFSGEAFYKKLSDLPHLIEGTIRFNGYGKSYGCEVVAERKSATGVRGWLSYAYCRSRRDNLRDTALISAITDIPHQINAAATVPLFWLLQLSGRARYASGRPYTAVIGTEFAYSSYWNNDIWSPVLDINRSQRLAPYFRADLRLERGWSWQGFSWSAYIECINITDHANMAGYIYLDEWTQRKPYYMIPRLFFLGLRMEL